jgi:hypothetical protein
MLLQVRLRACWQIESPCSYEKMQEHEQFHQQGRPCNTVAGQAACLLASRTPPAGMKDI